MNDYIYRLLSLIAVDIIDISYTLCAAAKSTDLTICQSKSIGHMVHLSSWTWIFLALVTFVYSLIANMIENNMKVRLDCYVFPGEFFTVVYSPIYVIQNRSLHGFGQVSS